MRRKPKAIWKWVLMAGCFLFIFMIGVHAMNAHESNRHHDRMHGYAGYESSMDGMRGHMTNIQVFPYGGQEMEVGHHGAFIVPLLFMLGMGLLIVGCIGFWLYRRMKRNAAVIEPVTTYIGTHNPPVRNGDVLDEWENHIRKEEK
jgi:hypothetical protein